MKVLIAEDCGSTQRLLGAMLERWGYEPIITSDGTEAYDTLLKNLDIELAIVDWEMPGMEGPELCRALDRAARYVYCILLTGRDGVENISYALDAGASDYVCKPCGPTELRARIRSGERLLALQNRGHRVGELSADGSVNPSGGSIQELATNLCRIQKASADVTRVLAGVRALLECVQAGEGIPEAAGQVHDLLAESGLQDGGGDVPRLVVESQRMARALSARLYAFETPAALESSKELDLVADESSADAGSDQHPEPNPEAQTSSELGATRGSTAGDPATERSEPEEADPEPETSEREDSDSGGAESDDSDDLKQAS